MISPSKHKDRSGKKGIFKLIRLKKCGNSSVIRLKKCNGGSSIRSKKCNLVLLDLY